MGKALDIEKLFEEAKQIIKKEKLTFITDIQMMLPISNGSFYKYWPAGSDELKEMEELLSKNKIRKKMCRRNAWENSDNATLQMGWYKLHADDDELSRLNGSQIDVKGEMNMVHKMTYDFGEELENDKDQ